MKKSKIKNYLLLTFLLFGCGGSGDNGKDPISFSETSGTVGYVQLNISNSESPNLSEVGTIKNYKVKIEGNGFAPIEQTISKEAAGVLIQGVPQGSNRRVEISALNQKGQVLREGAVENFTIAGGEQKALDVKLEPVPVLLNLNDGDYQSNRRLYFHVLTDPEHRLMFKDAVVESDKEGFAKIYPGVLPSGDCPIEIIDQDSGKSSKILIHLWEGQDIYGAPLWAASQISKRMGQSLVRESQKGVVEGELFANIKEALWKK